MAETTAVVDLTTGQVVVRDRTVAEQAEVDARRAAALPYTVRKLAISTAADPYQILAPESANA